MDGNVIESVTLRREGQPDVDLTEQVRSHMGKTPMKNTAEDQAVADRVHDATARDLRSIVERIETMEGEIAEARRDVKDIYAEAKGRGYSPAILRKIVALRKKDRDALAEEDALLALYRDAVGI